MPSILQDYKPQLHRREAMAFAVDRFKAGAARGYDATA